MTSSLPLAFPFFLFVRTEPCFGGSRRSDTVDQGCRDAAMTPKKSRDSARNAKLHKRKTRTARDCKASRVRSFVKVCWPRRCSMVVVQVVMVVVTAIVEVALSTRSLAPRYDFSHGDPRWKCRIRNMLEMCACFREFAAFARRAHMQSAPFRGRWVEILYPCSLGEHLTATCRMNDITLMIGLWSRSSQESNFQIGGSCVVHYLIIVSRGIVKD